ncbi:MAG: HAMP domain-containing protein [Anaerolineales bacterium]|nr:HAMP domain-containing protein [Anaerolineales bacterium]
MLRSLRSRLFFTYLLVAGIILALVAITLLVVLVRNIERLELGRLGILLNALVLRDAPALSRLMPDRLTDFVVRVDQLTNVNIRILVVNASGKVIADSRSGKGKLPQDVINRIMSSEDGLSGRFGDRGSGTWLYVSSPINEQRWVIFASPRPTLRALSIWRDDLLIPLLRAGLVALLVSAILAWLIARWVAAPLGKAAHVARAVASGNYHQKIDVSGPAEAESMAVAFNEMVRRVQASQNSQRDFVANVSHELKTPLTSIQGFAQAILDGTIESAEERMHAAQVIYDESDRLRRLVEDLLDLARIDSGQVAFERQPVDLGTLVHGVVERLGVRAVEQDVRLDNQLPPLPIIIGDGDRLAQVFTNLIDNAIKHTLEGTKVTLRGEIGTGWVSIHVDDKGRGIPADELSRIFERFYQLDKARAGGQKRGAGLGLAISREIVQAHGGRLVAQSVVGSGSRFTVQLPIVLPGDRTLTHSPP